MNSDILNQKYCTLINIHLKNKKKNNKITEAIAYQLNNLSNVEIKIISIINSIQLTLNNELNKDCDLSNIILGLIYLYNSKIIIYNLPSMLNKVNYNNRPCVHVLFGETVSQLTSVSLVTECFELIGSEIDEGIKYNNILTLCDININEDIIICINNNDNIKENLEKLLKLSIKELYNKAIDICLNYYNINDSSKKDEIKKHIKYKFDLE